jgi:hypothetical protein
MACLIPQPTAIEHLGLPYCVEVMVGEIAHMSPRDNMRSDRASFLAFGKGSGNPAGYVVKYLMRKVQVVVHHLRNRSCHRAVHLLSIQYQSLSTMLKAVIQAGPCDIRLVS